MTESSQTRWPQPQGSTLPFYFREHEQKAFSSFEALVFAIGLHYRDTMPSTLLLRLHSGHSDIVVEAVRGPWDAKDDTIYHHDKLQNAFIGIGDLPKGFRDIWISRHGYWGYLKDDEAENKPMGEDWQ